jgi:hypothetical protein
VRQHQVSGLHSRRVAGPEDHRHVHELRESPPFPLLAEVADGGEPLLLCGQDRPDGVLRVPTSRDGDEHITGLSQRVDLVGKGVVVAVVVGDGGENGGVCVEGERRQGRPVPLELTDELRDEVLGLCSGPAVATREHLTPPLVAGNDERRRLPGRPCRKAPEHPACPVRPVAGPARRGAVPQGDVHRRGSGASARPLVTRDRPTGSVREASMSP